MSTIVGGHYPAPASRGRAVRPDAYTENNIIQEVGEEIKRLADHLTRKHSLKQGVADILLLEVMAQTLLQYAGSETSRFLEELAYGPEQDPLVLCSLRDDLADVLEDIPRH